MGKVVFKTRVHPQKGTSLCHVGAQWLSARALSPHEVFAWYMVEPGAEVCQVDLGYVPTGVEVSETSVPGILEPHFIDSVFWDEEGRPQIFHVFLYP